MRLVEAYAATGAEQCWSEHTAKVSSNHEMVKQQ